MTGDMKRPPAGEPGAESNSSLAGAEPENDSTTALADLAYAEIIAEGVEIALATNAIVVAVAGRIAIVPDVVMIEGLANGQPAPRTWTLRRDDGRCAYLFRLPGGER